MFCNGHIRRSRPNQFEAPVRGRSQVRAVLGHGQAVKAPIWTVKDDGPGRKHIN